MCGECDGMVMIVLMMLHRYKINYNTADNNFDFQNAYKIGL